MTNPEALDSAIAQAITMLEANIRKAVGDMRPSKAIEFIRALQELREEEAHYLSTIQKNNT
ncbi:MAG: hypothetical protein VXW24_02465 [Bacteroidota bacterium]|nr:hypothetical protein [Bacteroidota bacterium]